MTSRLYKTDGIVLKRKTIGESDRIVTILTKEYGKVKTIAKGVRRITSRRAGHLEVFTNARFTLYKGKTFDYITEVTALTQYEEFRTELSKASFAYYICELADHLLPERQEQTEIYERVNDSFSIIAHSTTEEERHAEVYMFALDVLWFLGFLPRSQTIPAASMHGYIESLIERELKTLKLFEI